MKVDPELTSLFSLGGTTSKIFSHLRTSSEYCKGENEISVWIAHFMYDLVNFFAVYLPDRSQCYVVSMQGHKLFPREINYFPISIWKWSLHTEISFAHLQYSLKVRNWEKTWTRDGQFSSLVRFKTTSLNWISLVMKIDHPLFTFFPARVPFVSYCDVSKIHILS